MQCSRHIRSKHDCLSEIQISLAILYFYLLHLTTLNQHNTSSGQAAISPAPPDKNIQICERILHIIQRGSISDALKEVGEDFRGLFFFFFFGGWLSFSKDLMGGYSICWTGSPRTEKIKVYDPVSDYQTGKINACYILVKNNSNSAIRQYEKLECINQGF